MLKASCPKCQHPCEARSTWEADDFGYGGRGCPTSQPGYEDRAAVLLFFAEESLSELVKDEDTKHWLETGEAPLQWRFKRQKAGPNMIARIVTRHRAVTTAGLREQTWAAKKAFTKVMALVAQLGAKRRGPGLSPADKNLVEKLGEIAGLLEEARLSE